MKNTEDEIENLSEDVQILCVNEVNKFIDKKRIDIDVFKYVSFQMAIKNSVKELFSGCNFKIKIGDLKNES